jgi:hypothetical protein
MSGDLKSEPPACQNTVLSGWALPENWRKGMRPKTDNGKANAAVQRKGPNAGDSGSRTEALNRASKGNSGNGPNQAGDSDGSAATRSDEELDQRILGMEKAVGTALYRNIQRGYGRVQPKLIRDAAIKQKVLEIAEVDCTRH